MNSMPDVNDPETIDDDLPLGDTGEDEGEEDDEDE